MKTSSVRGVVSSSVPLERQEIETLMPHAPAWVFVDRVLECRPPLFIRTQKLIDPKDLYVENHFQGLYTAYPGVLLVEYAGQSAYLLNRLGEPSSEKPAVKLLARCNATFVSPARAGDLLTADVRQIDNVGGVVVCEAVVNCGDRQICRVRLFAAPLPPEGAVSGVHYERT